MSRTKVEHLVNSSLSVVIPTLNEAANLAACLASLEVGGHLIREIIIVDGGSTDGTTALAGNNKLLHASPGRGGQLRAGIAAASGEFLLLLHADTQLSPEWPLAAVNTGAKFAGFFQFKLASPHPLARVIEQAVALRCRLFSLPYGDQGLLISQTLLARCGGMPDLPLMEDVALARQLRGQLRPLKASATTSAKRYEQDGWVRRPVRNLFYLFLYLAGVKPSLIRKFYG